MPLHVSDASDGLHLWAAGSELIEMLELALLQQELAATVAGELVSHPAEDTCYYKGYYIVGPSHKEDSGDVAFRLTFHS